MSTRIHFCFHDDDAKALAAEILFHLKMPQIKTSGESEGAAGADNNRQMNLYY